VRSFIVRGRFDVKRASVKKRKLSHGKTRKRYEKNYGIARRNILRSGTTDGGGDSFNAYGAHADFRKSENNNGAAADNVRRINYHAGLTDEKYR